MPQAYWIIPLEGGGGQIDNTLPGGRPPHVGNRPPGSWDGTHPGNRPPGSGGDPVDPGWGGGWAGGGPHPGNRPPGSGEYPSGQPIVPPQGGTEVPEDVYQPAPVPEEIASQYVVTVYDPRTMTYTTKTYPPH